MHELLDDPMAGEPEGPLLRCYPALQKGDVVFAATTLVIDGSIPGVEQNQILAEPGTMGMLVNAGHLEEDPAQELLLVGFHLPDGQLVMVTCLPDEISPDAPETALAGS